MGEKNNNTYFILDNEKLLSINNIEFIKNIKNCYYIKKYGSNMHPEIYLDIKKDNEWIKNNEYIKDYHSLINLITENNNEFIILNGFSRVGISRIVRTIDQQKGTNTKLIRIRKRR